MGEVGLSLFFIVLFGIMNYKGAKSVGNLQLAMVLIMCAAVVVSVIGVIATGHFDASNLQPAYGAEGQVSWKRFCIYPGIGSVPLRRI